MFLDNHDLVGLHSQVLELERHIKQQERVLAELQRLGEPTHLAEKYLGRLKDRLEVRRNLRDRQTLGAATENVEAG